MKHITSILFLFISIASFAQQRITVKVQGSGNTFDSTQVNAKLAEN